MDSTAPAVPDLDRTLAAFLDLVSMPWECAKAVHDWQVEWNHFWAHYCMCSAFPPHPHESACQLEIPDPIAAEEEQDLFA